MAFDEISRIGETERGALELMALANISTHPLAQASLSLAAVELLSAGGGWTKLQKQLLKRLEQDARSNVFRHAILALAPIWCNAVMVHR
ncbi:hypothetical protein SAMN04487974_1319 [Pelagibacterium luteolum]|uniref:Uncharacterized protein n=1 Tax=Pelagibacterium luteolum TaxID=440168 RepID=A0A1G8AIQ3_9HYPH|nr:hypothetical protein SAMN04487974_1319 [Pelagibacterium luteolum]